MLETIMQSEVWAVLVALLPSLTGIASTVIAAILAIKKVGTVIAEFRQSNEVKQLLATMKTQAMENEQLKKLNEKLLVELTRIKPVGWTDDKEAEIVKQINKLKDGIKTDGEHKN